MADGWIVIPNWDRFQHYKNRNPAWIKVYTEILDNTDFRALTGAQKGLLFDLWLLYAITHRQVPHSAAWLAHRLGGITEWEYRRWRESGERTLSECREQREFVLRVRDLKALERRGFIEVSASRPLAQSKRESNKELEPSANAVENHNDAVKRIRELAASIGHPVPLH